MKTRVFPIFLTDKSFFLEGFIEETESRYNTVAQA